MNPASTLPTRPRELDDPDRPQPIIVLNDLYKRHGSTPALDGLSLTINRGSIFALLGPNGSGKTTTLKLLLGLCAPDSGTGEVFGLRIDQETDSVAIRSRCGFVSETKELFPSLTVEQTVKMVRAFYSQWQRDVEQRLLREFSLPPRARVSTLSKGMRAKLALLVACCRRAQLLILDEPTDGLDPASAEQLLETLLGLAAEHGTTVLLSSHHLHEVERIADTVAFMRSGRVVLQGDLDDLREDVRRLVIGPLSSASTAETELRVQQIARDVGARVLHCRQSQIGEACQLEILVLRHSQPLAERLDQEYSTTVDREPVSLRELYLYLTGARD